MSPLCQPPPYCGECDRCTGKRKQAKPKLSDRDFIAVARRRVADYRRSILWGRKANAAVLTTVIEVLIERLERKEPTDDR